MRFLRKVYAKYDVLPAEAAARVNLKGLESEAAKYKTFAEFKKAFLVDIKHGLYWHVTSDPNFKIDPSKGPRDMSSMSDGKPSIGKLMVTSHLRNWTDYYGKDRSYAAEIDMSDVDPKDYQQAARGFGNEFWVENPAKSKVVKVYSIAQALRKDAQYRNKLPNNEAELRQIFDKVHAGYEGLPAEAAPASEFAADTYYHGTKTEKQAMGIWESGIKPDLWDGGSTLGKPIEGRVYVTKNLGYALHYALGAAMAGSDTPYNKKLIEKHGQYGYMAVIPGSELKEVHADEDQIGEAVQDAFKFKSMKWLQELAADHLDVDFEEESDDGPIVNSLLSQIKEGNYDAWIAAGKILMDELTPEMHLEIIREYGNIAHEGSLMPSEMWKIDRNLIPKLAKDGSNFFDLAVKIKSRAH